MAGADLIRHAAASSPDGRYKSSPDTIYEDNSHFPPGRSFPRRTVDDSLLFFIVHRTLIQKAILREGYRDGFNETPLRRRRPLIFDSATIR